MLVNIFGQMKYCIYLCRAKQNNMNLELFDIVLAGSVTMKSLLLLLAVPETVAVENKNSNKNIENVMAKHPEYKDNIDVNDMMKFIFNDNFKQETYLDQNNITYLYELKILKDTFSEYYFKSLDEIKGNHRFVCDVHSRIGRLGLQLMRLRSIIEPQFNISINPHNQTKIDYLVVKSYWLNDEGKKVRKFTKSIGRLDEIKDGRTSKEASELGRVKIQEVMFGHYKEIYV